MYRIHRLAAALAALCVLLLAPAPAFADLRLTPFFGTTSFDGENKGTFGIGVAFGGLLGLEFEAARINLGRFDDIPVVDVEAHATTYMGNFVVRLPAGPVQPYGTVGLGVVRVTGNVDVPIVGDVVSATASDYGWNLGGGVYLFPAKNIGIRGDVRHFRTGNLSFTDLLDIGGLNDLPLPELDFWRATGGITFRF